MKKELTAVGLALVLSTTSQAAGSVPFGLRGVQLGITLAEFQAIPVPPDEGEADRQSIDQQFHVRAAATFYRTECDAPRPDVTCKWMIHERGADFGSQERTAIGNGSGYIDFEFVDAPDGNKRLAQIAVQSNMVQFSDLSAAYTAKYGQPRTATSQVQNGYGASFDQQAMTWSNDVSDIVMRTRCGQVDWLCITYSDFALEAIVADQKKKAAAAAASGL
jgi:hypothetical protein